MISELGLRYAPSGAADRDAHTAKFALLASDVSDLNPLHLRAAIARWVSFKPFPPKASELRAIVEAIRDEQSDPSNLQEWCDERNAWARRMGLDWWYRVTQREVTAGHLRNEVEKLEGHRAIEARAYAERRPIREWKPRPGEIEAINTKIAKLVARGMSQHEFNMLVDQGRA